MPAQITMLMADLARGAYAQWKLQRILPLVLAIVMVTFVASAMVSVAVIGIFYAAYLALLHEGIEEPTAAIAVAAIFLASTVGLLAAIKNAVTRGLQQRSPRSSGAVGAFLDGLFAE